MLKKLREINDLLSNLNKENRNDGGLMGGLSGIAIFFFYYAKYSDNQKYYDIGHNLLFEIIEHIKNNLKNTTFATGISGMAWTIEHLEQNNFIITDTNESFLDLDTYFYNSMMENIKVRNYDFLHGAIGIGIYLLTRIFKNKKIEGYLIHLIEEIENNCIIEKNGAIKWASYINIEHGAKLINNLSLSHGLASIIVF